MTGTGKIFVIGDSHIGLTEGSDRPVTEWLDRLAALQPKALYLNGDLFHYLIANDKFRTPSVDAVMAHLRALRDRGTRVHYVEGNRDFFLRGSFVETSVTDIATEYAVPAGTRRYLVIHGDLINDRDWPYRFWRRASKNAITKLGVQVIPARFARGMVDAAERHLAKTNFKHKTRLPVELMEAYARRRAREGFTDVVFGHFHNKTVLPGKARVTVLPAWYESGEAMCIDPVTGEYEFVAV